MDYASLTKREVKIAEYWPMSLLRFYCMRQSQDQTKSVSTKLCYDSIVVH